MSRHETYQLVRRQEPRSTLARLVGMVRSSWTGPITVKSPEIARILGAQPSTTGIAVSEATALTYAAFWSAVNLISNDVASLPLVHLKVDENGAKQRWRDSRLYKLLHDQPNPEMSSVTFRRALQAHVLTWGNGYAEIERDALGRPVALWLLLPNQVAIMRDTSGALFYRWTSETGASEDFAPRDILHVAGLGFDGICGYSVVGKARESLGLGMAMEKFGATFFGNGATFGGVFEHPGEMSPDAQERFRKSIEQRHGGVERAHRFLIAEEGMKYQTLGIPPNDAQFLESRSFQVLEVCRWFNMPPHKLAHLADATFSNVEQQNIDYYASTLRHWLTTWEQEGKRKLISPLEWAQQDIEHVVEDFLRADSAGRAALETAHFNIGAVMPDEIRKVEGRGPVPGGNRAFVQMNMMPLDRVDEYIDSLIKKNTAPPREPVPAPQLPAADDRAVVLLQEWRQEHEALRAEVDAARQAAGAASQRADDLSAALTEASNARDTAMADLVHVRELLDGAQTTLAAERSTWDATQERLVASGTASEAALAAVMKERDGLRNQLDAETAAHAATRDLLADVEAARDRGIADLATLSAERDGLQVALAAATVARSEAVDGMNAALAAQFAAEAAQAAAVQRAEQAERDRDIATHAQTAANETIEQRRLGEVNRLSAVITAHRGLMVDAMSRMVRRETEKARRHQATPQKLRAWMEVFYAQHEDTLIEAITPIVRAHLAWMLSSDDPEAIAREIARRHVAESQEQLRNVLVVEDFNKALERMLDRWEQRRADVAADHFVQQGVEYVRSYR